MKKQLLSLIVLVVVLCLTACTANQNQVSKPTSPENLGYSISREKISQTVLEDSELKCIKVKEAREHEKIKQVVKLLM